MNTPIKSTNPANRAERYALQRSYDSALEMDNNPTPFANIRTPEDRLREACRAALKLLENGEASELTVALPADEAGEVMEQLSLVLGSVK